jgi:hypothetical protein
MSLPKSDQEKLERLSLLMPERVEIIHPMARAHTIIGYSIYPDECWSNGDGLDMLTALERMAGVRWPQLRRGYRRLIGGRL